MDVLFLSVSTGGGHLKAAEAIKNVVEEKYPGSRTLIVDTLDYINPAVNKLIVGGYLGLLKSTPRVYGKLYDLAESKEGLHELYTAANTLLAIKLGRLIDDFMPSIIICTHIFPLRMLSCLKRRGKAKMPVVAVITDYVSHSLWVHNNINAYIVPNDQVKNEMIMRGISAELIYPCGIPIDKRFARKKNRDSLLRELGLEDRFTVLIMGGSLGLGKLYSVFDALLNNSRDIQIIAITGYNEKLKKQLENISSVSDKKIRIFSYTDKISDLMDISDLIITKPGGMTSAEALAKGLPMLITSVIPGQEERNARFLVNNGAAVKISDHSSINSVIDNIIANPSCIESMRKRAYKLAKPNSAEDIAALLEELSQKYMAEAN
ncbi:MGDG synthase family glycosyltransferase [Clostridium thermosuccinogenes]|jgi:processive 1,2-diacylglycerol beta-glucosyltransferase|uniref:MGDG synthase family glycosyltransferase n=1 Tax=Clostridium thermosuccinogenes TaxID=84032 RepID=UPI000CCC86CE|nr:glycosyltransferase [Pseudoclostridium thermosuccinogenes]PNT90877.1 UDP-N-acetylglucosamine--LPS N-acetylglucosamine transferase [Pseudoclostridium thermosuccinogenes]